MGERETIIRLEGMLKLLASSCVFMSMVLPSSAQSCSKYAFPSNRVFSSCNDLPYLNSFIHWKFDSSSSSRVEIAYRHTGVTPSMWVSWAINPDSAGMVGSQALVAYQNSDGTIKVYTSSVDAYSTTLPESKLSFPVSDLSATYSNSEMTIYATLELPNNGTTVNQVWQHGPLSPSTNSPGAHQFSGPNVASMGTLDLLSGQSAAAPSGNSRLRKRNIHGVLNAVSWGILMPIGAILARYVKVFESADPAWFYLHVTCQCSAYIIGVFGWATGIKLGSQSSGIQHTVHRTIGIVLFCLGTLQVFALLLRPNKDHKYRKYWNVYHHSVGYTVIILGIINIYKGLDILDPEKKWRRAYTGIIAVLGLIAVLLEAFTWNVALKRKKKAGSSGKTNGANDVNGSGAKPTEA